MMSIKSWAITQFLKGRLPNWVYRLVGKKLANAAKLEDTMETKKWFKSKSVWTAIIGVVLGAVTPISNAFGHPIVIPTWVFEVLAGFGLYSLRVGDKPIA